MSSTREKKKVRRGLSGLFQGLPPSELLLYAALLWALYAYGAQERFLWTAVPFWIGAYGSCALAFTERSTRPRPGALPPLLAILGVLAVLLLLWSGLTTPQGADLFVRGQRLLSMGATVALGYTAVHLLLDAPGSRRRLLLFLVGIGVVEALLGLLQASGVILSTAGKGDGTAAGTFRNRNYLCGLLEVCLFATLAKGLDPKEATSTRSLFLYGAFLVLATIGVASSRGGWIASAAGLATFSLLLSLRDRDWRPLVGVVLLLGFSSSLALSTDQRVMERRAGQLQDAVLEDSDWMRSRLWDSALRIARDHPLFGVGVGNFGTYFPRYRAEGVYMERWNCYQDFLQTAAEGGVPALLLFLALLLLPAGVLASRSLRSESRRQALLAAGALAALTAFSVHGLVDFNFRIPSNATTLALLVLVALLSQEKPSEDPPDPAGHAPRLLSGVLAASGLLLALVFYQHDALVQASSQALADGEFRQAADLAREAEGWIPTNPRASLLRAEALQKLARTSPDALAQELYQEARHAYQRAIGLTPTDGRAHLGALLLEEQIARREDSLDPGTILEGFRELAARFPHDPEIQVPYGARLQQGGSWEEGSRILRDGFESLPDQYFRTRYLLPFVEKGGDVLSMTDFMPRNSAPGWGLVAAAHTKKGNHEGALEAWRRAQEALPESPGPRIGAASTLLAMRRNREAREELQVAARLGGEELPPDYYLLLHAIQELEGDHKGALETSQAASERFPEDVSWKVRVCRHQVRVGNAQDAFNQLRSYLGSYEDSPEPHRALGDLLVEQGVREENRQLLRQAAFHYREALLRNRHDFESTRALSRLYHRLGDEERAEPLLQDLLANRQATPQDLTRLADLWTARGRFRGSLRLLEPIPKGLRSRKVEGRTIASRIRDLRALVAVTPSEVAPESASPSP